MQPSSFFWKISYMCAASLSGTECVTRSMTPSGSDGSSTRGNRSSIQCWTLHWPMRIAICLSKSDFIGSGSASPP